MFGVRLRNEALELDRPIGDLLDDLSDARQALESRAETAELEFREFFVNVCILFNVATTEPVGDGIEVDRLTDDVLYDLGIVRQGLGEMNPPPSEAADVLAEVLDERARLIKALGLDPSLTTEQVLGRVEELAQFLDGVDEAFQDLDLPQTADDVIARVENLPPSEAADVLAEVLDERARLIGALELDPSASRDDVISWIEAKDRHARDMKASLKYISQELMDLYSALSVEYPGHVEALARIEKLTNQIPDSGPLRGVL